MRKLFSLSIPSDTRNYSQSQDLYRKIYARTATIIALPLCAFFTIYNIWVSRYVSSGIVFLMFLTLCILLYENIKQAKTRKSDLFQKALSRLLLSFFIFYLIYTVGYEHSLSKIPWFLVFPALIFYSTSLKEALLWISGIAAFLIYVLFHHDLYVSPDEIAHLKIRLILIFGILASVAFVTNVIMRSAIKNLYANQKKLEDANLRLNSKVKEHLQTVISLRESEEKTRTTFNAISDAVFLHPLLKEGFAPFEDINNTACERYGYAREEFLSLKAPDITKKSDVSAHSATDHRQRLHDLGRLIFETIHITKSGKEIPVEINSAIIKLKGRPMILAVARDITDRKAAEDALQESEKRYRSVSELTSDYAYAFRVEPDGNIVNEWTTDALIRVTGYSNDELKTLGGWEHLICADDITIARDQLQALLSNQDKTVEYRIANKNGEIRWMRDHARPEWNDAQKRVTYIEGAVQDISDRKNIEEALQASHKRFLTVLDSIKATIYVADMETHEILFMNKDMIDSFGRDMTGDICWKVFRGESGPCPNCTNDRLIDNNGKPTEGYGWQGKNPILDKSFINYDRAIEWSDGRLVRLQIATDITDLKKMEGKLRQAQKMEAIGTLAGGMAHNFNNLLMGIQGRTSLMSVDLEPSHPHLEHVTAIKDYIESAVDLTKQLLGIVRGGKYEVKPIDLNALVTESAAMFGRTRKELQVETKILPSKMVVEADRSQIEQVLLNMYVNAWQAMPEGGKLYIETLIVSFDDVSGRSLQIEPGDYCAISVVDTGIGMDNDTCRQIYDPFFTTKESGQGTGLGLASAYGIIKNHGGMITVSSEVGQGTTFNIYLPISEKDVPQKILQDVKMLKGTGTILLVDDQKMILEVGKAILEKLGYEVIMANSGQEAIDAVSEQGEDINLVILDLIMPEMDGKKTYDGIRAICPEIPIIISSGYAIDGQATDLLDRGCNGFIQKPFDIYGLSQKVHEIMNETKTTDYRFISQSL